MNKKDYLRIESNRDIKRIESNIKGIIKLAETFILALVIIFASLCGSHTLKRAGIFYHHLKLTQYNRFRLLAPCSVPPSHSHIIKHTLRCNQLSYKWCVIWKNGFLAWWMVWRKMLLDKIHLFQPNKWYKARVTSKNVVLNCSNCTYSHGIRFNEQNWIRLRSTRNGWLHFIGPKADNIKCACFTWRNESINLYRMQTHLLSFAECKERERENKSVHINRSHECSLHHFKRNGRKKPENMQKKKLPPKIATIYMTSVNTRP